MQRASGVLHPDLHINIIPNKGIATVEKSLLQHSDKQKTSEYANELP